MHYELFWKDLTKEGEIFYVSGYDNSNLRKVAATNTKPQKVMMKLYTELYPNSPYPGIEHLIPVHLDKQGNGTTKIFQVYTDIHRFYDNEQDCINHYNNSIDKVVKKIEEFKDKTLKNKI